MDHKTIDTPAEDIREAEEQHDICRVLMRGVEAMRERASRWRYMRPNEGELEYVPLGGENSAPAGEPFTVYDARVDRSPLPNPWAHGVRRIAALPFRSRVRLQGWDETVIGRTERDAEGQVTGRIPGWVDDMDGEGRNIDEWAADYFVTQVSEGIVFGLVDLPRGRFPVQSPEVRPFVSKIRRGRLRRLTLERYRGRVRVKQLVFYEPQRVTNVEDPNAWRDGVEPAFKVLDAGVESGNGFSPVRSRLYVRKDDGSYAHDPEQDATITPADKRERLVDIPLVPFYGNRLGPFSGRSPFLNAAHTNAALFVHTSELLAKSRETSLAYLHESGVMEPARGPGSVVAGAPVLENSRGLRYRYTTKEGGRLNFVEQSGESMLALMKVVEFLSATVEREIEQVQSDRPTGPVTAREITLVGVHAVSALEMFVLFAEAGWTRVLDLFALLGGREQGGTASIPHDFGLPNTGMERNHSLFLAGRMHPANYWREAMRHGDVHERQFDLGAELNLHQEAGSADALLAALEAEARGDAER